MEDNFLKRILNILTNRLLIISVVFVVLFYILLAKLFTLQIVEGETYKNQQEVTDTVTLPVAATRGCIYDRLGRPLAVNETAFTVLMDANTAITADTFYQVVQLFEKNGETAVDTLPITKTEPYQFVWANSGTNETRWKTDMGFADKDMGLDAADSFNKLRTKFKIPDDMPNSEARKVLNLCCMLYLQRYHTYDPITIAYDVKQDTVTTIEEQNARYTGIYVDTQDLRYYPEGVYFANIIGYTGGMGGLSQDALDEKLAQGYSLSDKIGKTGLESSEESYLRGTSGSVTAEVDSLGKVVGYLPDKIDPQPGNDIYLTMDADFQKKFSDFLENALSQTLQNELLGIGATATADTHITLEEVFSSMVNGNVISVEQIMSSTQSDDSYAVRQYVLSANPNWAFPADRDFTATKKIITDGITGGSISSATMLLVMMDQGLITGTASDAANIRSGAASPLTVVLDKMQAGEITPQMVGLDPCTGSAVMVNVKNGDVLAAAGYPSFDPNELVNNMNIEYYNQINNDPTTPMYDRPFKEMRPPGSVFKMITATAALEKGSITPTSTIYDDVIFKDAGLPYLKNWSPISNGNINVTRALEVSCNYFFCDSAYLLGNAKNDGTLTAIGDLNEYMKYYGLNNDTGVEIGEAETPPDGVDRISGPLLKAYTVSQRSPNAASSDLAWHDGDTVQTAIGQSYNNYTAASMCKYIMTIATKGIRYQLHLVDSVVSHDRTQTTKTQPVIEESPSDLPIADSTWDAIYQGMYDVIHGTSGTGYNTFKGLDIEVAGKTGTAQQITGRNDHSSFGGFAPYDDPQIAVYVMIPFGDTKANPAVSSQIARDMIAYYFGVDAGAVDIKDSDTLVP